MEAQATTQEETAVLLAEIRELRERLRRAERSYEARLRDVAHQHRPIVGVPASEPGPHRARLEAELERDRALAERDALRAERDALRADLTTVYGSRSWRIGRRIVNIGRAVVRPVSRREE
jgi:hypothetical protein